MGRDYSQLKSAKASYREAKATGNRQEEARWANVISDILKQRGEYVEALRWLKLDYEISVKHLPQRHLLPTCQSLGEVHLRLQQFEEALKYQKKHLGLAKDMNDLVEQQRACTQLGRTYYEIYSRSENDHSALRNSKKYFKAAMELAQTLKENPLSNKSSFFVKEFIDAHNNLGMLEIDLDNFNAAQKFLVKGLKICDDEEVNHDDDARSRLHNNLGTLYTKIRAWDKAREHIERDIRICKKIGHPQGEAKGFINLGELHYQVQKYDDANLCYQKALDIAVSMEDEDPLVDLINQNIEIVKKAVEALEELKQEEQKLKKLARLTAVARGSEDERRLLLQQNSCLDRLIDQSSMIFAWTKHQEFAKRKKRVTAELCDKGKQADSFLAIGESYQKLRKFEKALKWYMKSWNAYKSIGNLEGQAMSKINIGNVLDSSGDWAGSLQAFKEAYRIAVEGNLRSIQVCALENMHYSQMIRFDNIEEARKLQHHIQDLKDLLDGVEDDPDLEYCSETETEGLISDCPSDDFSSGGTSVSPKMSQELPLVEEPNDDAPLISLVRSSKKSLKIKRSPLHGEKSTSKVTNGSCKDHPQPIGCKRVRIVLSDDENNECEMNHSSKRPQNSPKEAIASPNKVKGKDEVTGPSHEFQDSLHANNCTDIPIAGTCTSIHLEESSCSCIPDSPKFTAVNVMEHRSYSVDTVANPYNSVASGSKSDGGHVPYNRQQTQTCAGYCMHNHEHGYGENVTFKIGDELLRVDVRRCMIGGTLSLDHMKVEISRLLYLRLCEGKRSKGVLPVIQQLKYDGKTLDSWETIATVPEKGCIEVSIDGWIQKRLLKLYIDQIDKLSELPNMKLLLKLYALEVSEDEVVVSDCELDDISISPFLNALQENGAFSVLDVSHNILGNTTMEKLRQIFASSCHKYRGLTLDLHCNRLGPVALSQICECPHLFAGLEVLNLSGNRLTDSCGSYLSTILDNCKALYSLSLEECSITSRTIQKIADALNAESVLTELCLGKNNPVTGNAICSLLAKLATLKRFSELNLNGVKLSKSAIDGLCELVKSSNLSGLMLGYTNIGAEGAVRLAEALSCGSNELVKLDLSCCGLSSHSLARTCENFLLIGGILELNLGWNSIGQEGTNALVSFLMNPECCLKVLVLERCHLRLAGILQIVQALAENESLEELNLAENADSEAANMLSCDAIANGCPRPPQHNIDVIDDSTVILAPDQVETLQTGLCVLNSEMIGVEVPDSDDESTRDGSASLDSNNTGSRLCQRNRSKACRLIKGLSKAISTAKQLQLLDLSGNGFPSEAIEVLYSSWALDSRLHGSAQKHVDDKIIHFSIEGKRCCGIKLCCRRY